MGINFAMRRNWRIIPCGFEERSSEERRAGMSSSTRLAGGGRGMEAGEMRWGERGAMCGWISAALWVVLGIDSIVRPIQDDRREVFWWFPFLFMMLTIVAVHRVQAWRGLRLERWTYGVVM